jgi:hypothetical protein
MFEADVRSQIRLIGHSGAPGDLLVGRWDPPYQEYDSWGSCNYRHEYGSHSGAAFKSGNAECGIGGTSKIGFFAFQRDLGNYFINVSDKPITVNLAYDYLVEARASVRGGTSGDYARSMASAEIYSSGWCQARHTFEMSADTLTGKAGGRLSGSLPIHFVLESGAFECVIDVNYDAYGEAVAAITRTTPIPLPAPAVFLGTALFGLVLVGRRRSRPTPAILQGREARRTASASRPAL